MLLLLALPARASPLLTVRAGHPRVHATPAAVARLQALPPWGPLQGASFPQAEGTVRFELCPSRQWYAALPATDNPADPNATQARRALDPVLGAYSSTAYGIVFRHADAATPPAGTCNFQLALTTHTSTYAAVATVALPCDAWTPVRISWRTGGATGPLLVYQLGAAAPVTVPPTTGWPAGGWTPASWAPSEQAFVLSGREDALDAVQLYAAFDPAARPDALVFDAELDEGAGLLVRDGATGEDRVQLVQPTWIAHGAGHAVRLAYGGPGHAPGTLAPASETPLRDLQVNLRRVADRHATSLLGAGQLEGVDVDALIGVTGNGHIDAIRQPARVLSLAWLVYGDPRYRDALWAYARHILAIADPTAGNDYAQNGRLEVLAFVYDALFAENGAPFDASRTWQQALLAAIEAQLADGTYPGANVCGAGRRLDPAQGWSCTAGTSAPVASGGHDHNANHVATRAVLAVLDEAPELRPVLDQLYLNMVELFLPFRAYASPQGGHYFGWAYGDYDQLDGVLLWEEATDASLRAPWMSSLVDFYAYGLRSDGHFPPVGDYFDIDAGFADLGVWGLFSSTRGENGAGRTFHEDHVIRAEVAAGAVPYLELAHFEDDVVARAPLEAQPLARLFPSNGVVVARESWDYASSAVLTFKSSSFYTGNHQHLDQNAITLHDRVPLLLDAGVYDAYGSPHWLNYYSRTVAHCAATVLDPDERFVRGATAYANDGGQRWMTDYPTLAQAQEGGEDHLDGVTAFEEAGGYVYAEGNASKAYAPAKLDQADGFVRRIVFLPHPAFAARPALLVYDALHKAAAKAGLPARVLWQVAVEPEPLGGASLGVGQYRVDGDRFTVRGGGSALFGRTLLPSGAVLVKVGGQDGGDHRFGIADGAGGLVTFPPCTGPDCGGVAREAGAWRVEVSSPAPAERERFLHLFALADDGPGAAPPPSRLLAAAGGAFAALGDGPGLTVGFADPAGATEVAWSTPDPAQPFLVTGLAAGRAFRLSSAADGALSRLTLSADDTGAYRSTAQGVLYVEAPHPASGGSGDPTATPPRSGGCGTGGEGGAVAVLLATLVAWRPRAPRRER